MAAAGPVFVSYSSQDSDVANRFVRAIEAAGMRCWIAPRDIPPGSSYPAEITRAIESGGAMLVIVTPAANASPHVLREVEMGFNAGKPILPVHLTSVALSPNLTYFLSTRQWFDAGETFDSDDTEHVVRSLQKLLGTPPVPQSIRERESAPSLVRPAPSRRSRVMVAAAALVLVAVVGAYVATRSARSSTQQSNPAGDGVTTSAGERRSPPDGDAASVDVATRSADAAGASTPGSVPQSTSAELPPHGGTPTAPDRHSRINSVDGQTYVLIPAGAFAMGCSVGDSACDSDEQPSHQVTIERPFWLASTEVTGAQYQKVRPRARGSAATPDSPITEVTWVDAKAYCKAIGGRLPREAEWEYAARGGTPARAYGKLTAIGWFETNSDAHVHPVGRLQPNQYGLFDMLGNVHEWVLDRYFDSYGEDDDDAAVVEPVAPNASATVRGGAWTSAAKGLRASARLSRPPDTADPNIGFRCVLN